MSKPGHGQFVGALDVPLDLPLASAGSRSIAYLVDITLLVFIELAIALVLTLLNALRFEDFTATFAAGLVVAIFVMEWGYFILCEQVMGGQSPGKRVVGLRVVSDDGSDVGVLASILRNILRPIDLLPGAYGAGVLSIVLSGRHQRLGDMVAGTVVVLEQAEPDSSRPTRWPEGLDEDDVRLVETWFRRAPALKPEHRAELARDLLRWIERDHPDFVPPGEGDLETRLEDAFGVGRL